MEFKQFLYKNRVGIFALILYFLITFFIAFNRIPLFDESHAWLVSKFLTPNNWIDIVKTEGHPIIWYLLLAPYAKYTNWYPYPMLILNYLFSFLCLFLLWLKSPFSNILKLSITFSAMFLLKLSIFARGYSLGVLFLFLCCVLREYRLKMPVLYSTICAIALNINIMTSIGIFYFIIEHVINILKSNLSGLVKVVSVLIPVLGGLFMIFPYLDGYGTDISRGLSNNLGAKFLISFFTEHYCYLLIFYSVLFIISMLKIKNYSSRIFLVYTNIVMLILFTIFYPGFYHHFLFFFIYLIIFLWISDAENIIAKEKTINIINILTAFLIIPPINTNLEIENVLGYKYISNQKNIVKYINNEPKFKQSDLYVEVKEQNLVPYIKNDINVYDSCTMKPISWDILKYTECEHNYTKLIKKHNKPTFLISEKKYDIKNVKRMQYRNLYIYEY